ncbi:hypothetical protein PAMC26510_35910 [Caballeronia sordidicola]|uniref:Uncharacterized protein n=1 Tax=Caballeronia sordidicola TaxID=196367 RepID=A0A242M4U0_CABSO|nr:hypothetical protein PAMC26510_35910 [Caballeronia sordidicola]
MADLETSPQYRTQNQKYTRRKTSLGSEHHDAQFFGGQPVRVDRAL